MANLEPARNYTFHRLDERPRYGEDSHIGGYYPDLNPGDVEVSLTGDIRTFWIMCPGPADANEPCGWLVQCGHGVTEEGIVKPSIGHARCGFHCWATLDDWEHWEHPTFRNGFDPNGHLS